MKGFEPSTFAMARRRSSQLSYIRASGHSSLRATRALSGAETCARRASALERRAPGIAERLVALAHRLAKAALGRTRLKRVALGGVARDPIEHGPEHLAGVHTLGMQRLV